MAAPNRIPCPLCQASIKAPLLPPGAPCTCPKCGGAFRLPGGEAAPVTEEVAGSPAASAPTPSATARQPRPKTPEEQPEHYPELAAPEASEPAPTETAVACRLCHTRFYVPIKKIGSEVACPDCHTRNVVVAPPAKPKKAVVVATGDEYAFTEEPLPPRPSPTLFSPPAGEGDVSLRPPAARPPGAVNKELAAAMLAKAAEELNDKPDTPDINDELQPFFQGSLKLFQQPEAITLCVLLGVGAGLLAYDFRFVREKFSESLSLTHVIALFALACGAAGLMVVVGLLAAACQAIMQDTANGMQQVKNWPSANFFDWFHEAMLTLAAFAVAGFPGALIVWGLWTFALPGLILPAVALASLWILFPIVFLSMSEGNSLFAVATPAILGGFNRSGERWFLFYFATLLLAFGAFFLVVVLLEGSAWMVLPSCIALVAGAFLYSRWLGRLAQFISQDEALAEEKAARTQKFLKEVTPTTAEGSRPPIVPRSGPSTIGT